VNKVTHPAPGAARFGAVSFAVFTVIVAVALSLAACTTDEAPSSTLPPTSSTVPSSSTIFDQSSTTAPPSPASTIPITEYRATTVIEDLRIPWEMRFLPDGRLLITEREGRVVLADVGSGAVTEVGRIDVRARGEGGLMGLALDPDFPRTPAIYVSFTHAQEGDTRNRVSRFTLSGLDTAAPSLGSETVLLDGIPAGSNHNGSRVAFGPDGYLWVTTGDSGDGDLAQEMDSLAGKVLRMTREGEPAPDNPYLDEPYPFSLIYTLGHRNPQGLAFHPDTGVAYVTEHGPNDNDEVNRLQAGGNYGWPDLRGVAGEPGFVDPLMTWSPTIAPAGAVFYTGDLLGALKGSFVFVTLKESDVRVLAPEGGGSGAGDFLTVAGEEILFDDEFGRLRPIAQGPDGALYIGTSNYDGRGNPQSGDDRILRIEPGE
jgi:glucose/arabinose dehydrogenase